MVSNTVSSFTDANKKYRENLVNVIAAADVLFNNRQENKDNFIAICYRMLEQSEWLDKRLSSLQENVPIATPQGVARRRAALTAALEAKDAARAKELRDQLTALGVSAD